ncbi:MAG TPA: prephenate dehydratase [Thermoplasmata archaeon]|nr:prephenate dehydratase [Thermoplasmata archaeon]
MPRKAVSRTVRTNATADAVIQGERGSFSEAAALAHLGPKSTTLSANTFDAAFDALALGRAKHAVMPVENTLTGSIGPVVDLLKERAVVAVGEQKLHVRHCLMALPGVKAEELTKVASHPQALAQCAKFLSRSGLTAEAVYDTAGAAKTLASTRVRDRGVIAPERAARVWGLRVLEKDVQDDPENWTRFLVLVRDTPTTRIEEAATKRSPPRQGTEWKTTILFGTKHIPGALAMVLNDFAAAGLNLLKIESRPARGKPWEYWFWLDVAAGPEDREGRLKQALESTAHRSTFVKLLGTYPAK